MTMRHVTPKVAALILVTCFAVGSAAVPIRAGDDDRPIMNLDGWGQVVDPDGDCTIAVQGKEVEMKIPGTKHDFAAELGLRNAPRILRKVKGDFIAEVKVAGEFKPGAQSKIRGRRPYQGAGLIVMKDKDNYVSLHRGCVTLDTKVRHYANFELREGGKLATSGQDLDIPDGNICLKLERRGNKVFASTSPDGVAWTTLDPLTLPLPEATQLGVIGVNSAAVPLAVKFRDLAVFQKAELE